MAQEVYVFGDSAIDGTACPAVAAGREIPQNDEALTVAEEYDEVVRGRYGIDEGTLPSRIAESCWCEAIESVRLSAEYYETEDPEHSQYLWGAMGEGNDIAEELW